MHNTITCTKIVYRGSKHKLTNILTRSYLLTVYFNMQLICISVFISYSKLCFQICFSPSFIPVTKMLTILTTFLWLMCYYPFSPCLLHDLCTFIPSLFCLYPFHFYILFLQSLYPCLLICSYIWHSLWIIQWRMKL